MKDKVDIRLFLTALKSAVAEVDPTQTGSDLVISDFTDEVSASRSLAPVLVAFFQRFGRDALKELIMSMPMPDAELSEQEEDLA